MSTIKLENIQTRTGSGTITIGASGETVTIPSGVTLTNNGTASGFGGITMADQWRLTTDTNTSTNADITTNWERVDDTGWSGIGTGLTESSGIFSFPLTGIYLINLQARFSVAGSDGTMGIQIKTTVDNSTFTTVAQADAGNTSGSTSADASSQSILFDVTNITTHKLKFTTTAFASGSSVTGATDYNRTAFVATRLGDT